jgi:hypothetical protein
MNRAPYLSHSSGSSGELSPSARNNQTAGTIPLSHLPEQSRFPDDLDALAEALLLQLIGTHHLQWNNHRINGWATCQSVLKSPK